MAETQKPQVRIEYCTQCNWLLRAAWMAQELLSTFSGELGAVTLVPATGGHFEFWSMAQAFGSASAMAAFPRSRC